MSALDQAFIRAYARDQTVRDATQGGIEEGEAGTQRPVSADPPHGGDDLGGSSGIWHRLEQPSGAEAGAAPPPHAPFSRFRDSSAAPDPTQPQQPDNRLLETFSTTAYEPPGPRQAVSQHSVAATWGDLAALACGAGAVSTPLLPVGVQALIGLPAMPAEVDSSPPASATASPAGPVPAAASREACRSGDATHPCGAGCACGEASPPGLGDSVQEIAPERAPGAVGASPPCPSWEVDRFCWPSVCNRLSRRRLPFLDRAGERLQAAAREGLQVLAITSAESGAGCSTLAMCLARSAAASGGRAALMELDFDPPHLAARLGVDAACSWWDVVSRRLPLAEAAVLSLEDHLTLLPLTVADQGRRVAWDDPTVTEAIRQAASALDIVVIDVGPIAAMRALTSGRSNSCPIDAAIVVRDVRRTTEERARRIATQLHMMGVEAVGIAENFVPEGLESSRKTPDSLP